MSGGQASCLDTVDIKQETEDVADDATISDDIGGFRDTPRSWDSGVALGSYQYQCFISLLPDFEKMAHYIGSFHSIFIL